MSRENAHKLDLRPLGTSRLQGRTTGRGQALTVIDSDGTAVVEGALGKAAAPAEAMFRTAEGRWRVEASASGVAILDLKRRTVATARKGEVVLASGERLLWKRSTLPRVRYRFGDDLWVAKGSWLPRRFTAELSPALLAREDRSLLVGIASVLTQHAVAQRRSGLGAAGGFGASWG
jgi:hypothetical protein